MEEDEADLEEKVKKIMAGIDEASEPGVGWKYISKESKGAGTKYLKVHKGGEEIEESKYEEEFDKRAKTYLESVGIKTGKQGDEFYGHMMRTWAARLRKEDQARLEQAIKEGDELTTVSLMQEAYKTGIMEAKDHKLLADIERAKPNLRLKVYKKLATEIGGEDADYLRVVGNLNQSYLTLQKQRMLADSYQYVKKKAA
jgi:hypothetical protein